MNQSAPISIVIFGGTGDLAKNKLIPALFDLYKNNCLPKNFKILGFSRKDLSHEKYREFMKDSLELANKKDFEEFIKFGFYKQGDITDLNTYTNLSDYLKEIDSKAGVCTNKLFYLAVSPKLYKEVFINLHKSDLTTPCSTDTENNISWTRILVEKPFGNDLDQAKELDKLLGDLFDENQIFRIDHYLAKETLQNILTFRFANSIFEPSWNSKSIEKIEIRMFEKDGIRNRGAFYDSIGALRDVGQNHILQMLALIAMEDPEELKPENIREARRAVINKTKLSGNIKDSIIRAQYIGYKDIEGVDKNSETETYFKLKLNIDNARWKGTDFYLEHGKAMDKSLAEIKITFREKENCVYSTEDDIDNRNVLTFNIQPEEGIKLLFWKKKPGFVNELVKKELSFSYDKTEHRLPDPYERVLFDCIKGDQTLFNSTEEISEQWKIITPIIEKWGDVELVKYEQGWNPEERE